MTKEDFLSHPTLESQGALDGSDFSLGMRTPSIFYRKQCPTQNLGDTVMVVAFFVCAFV